MKLASPTSTTYLIPSKAVSISLNWTHVRATTKYVFVNTAIPLPIKLYVALRVDVAVILSQRPTPGTGYYRVFYKSFLWGNLRFGGCFEKPSLQALFWCKKLRSGRKIGKVTKRRRSVKPTCANGGTNRANGGTNRANGGTNASFCTSGDFQFFLARGQICFEFDSVTVKREK